MDKKALLYYKSVTLIEVDPELEGPTGQAYRGLGHLKALRVKATKRSLETSVAVGDVVTLRDRVDLMTVEAVHVETFGPVLDCIWFDADDCLRYRRYPANIIDVFPRPASEREIAVGTEVRLRSRGPVMTVRSLRDREGVQYAECVWTGPMGRERRRLFPISVLVLTIMERFIGLDGQDH